MESVGGMGEDAPPPPPPGVHSAEGGPPTYSKMMAVLVDQVKAAVDEQKPENRYEAYVKEVKVHRDKVADLQKQLLTELANDQEEESKKITSEGIRDGFNSSHVVKAPEKKAPAKAPAKTTTKSDKVQAVEVLNPHALKGHDKDVEQSSGADADVDEPLPVEDEDDEADVEATELGKKFSLIKQGDYRACLQFISQNPQVVAERETDGLLVLAFEACMAGQDKFGRQCVHNGLLLQYCKTLGRDGVGMFFKRVNTPGHQAQKVFFDDVNTTFDRIRSRAKEVEKQRAQEEAEGSGGVEQIQLHAVDPGTEINITIPPEKSEDPEEIKAREMFNSFPPGLQRALESGSLDDVNVVLGKMSVEEAEEVVAQLSEVSSTIRRMMRI